MIAAWVKKHCMRHPRISGGVVVLLRYLNAWLREQQREACSLDRFIGLLKKNGLEVVLVSGVLLVVGMGLKEDCRWLKR